MYSLFFERSLLPSIAVPAPSSAASGLLQLTGAHLPAAVTVAQVNEAFAVAVDAAHVDVALEEHVVHHEQGADERRPLLRRHAHVVHLDARSVPIRTRTRTYEPFLIW